MECFIEAHKDDLKSTFETIPDDETIRQMIIFKIKTMFKNAGEDFDNPTKESILKVMEKLKELAKHFRSPEIIGGHVKQMMCLINRLE